MKSEARGPVVQTPCDNDQDCARRPCASCGCKCIKNCCHCPTKPYFSDFWC